MSGALAERDFVAKLHRAGFVGVEAPYRQPVGVDDCEIYPLFGDEVIALMRALIPPERQDRVATAVVLRARRQA